MSVVCWPHADFIFERLQAEGLRINTLEVCSFVSAIAHSTVALTPRFFFSLSGSSNQAHRHTHRRNILTTGRRLLPYLRSRKLRSFGAPCVYTWVESATREPFRIVIARMVS